VRVTDLTTSLSAEHIRELVDGSAIDLAVIAERGYVTVGRPNATLRDEYGQDTRDRMKSLGFPSWSIREDYYFPGLHIPGYSPSGMRYAGQWKPFRAVPGRDGKPQRYASAKGPSRLDVHPRWSADRGGMQLPAIQDPSERLWITEGVKKADALTSRGCVTVALAGVYNWRNTHATLGDWEDVRIKGREVVVCFDADAATKPHVAQAMARLGQWLKSKGAARVSYVLPPGKGKGVDDYLAAGGTMAELERAMTTTPPRVLSDEDMFTDSALADQAAAAVLLDQYCRTAALGWLRWDGRVWLSADAGEVTETIRQHFREQYAEALRTDAADVAAGRAPTGNAEAWRKVQSASRIGAVLSLAGNIAGVFRDASLFDTDPDILNTPTGVVDLRTGEIMEHSPDLCCTKITAVGYHPGAESQAFKTALEAVPTDALDWLHLRIGQAATGYAADDGRMLLLTGTGNNGKTLIMGAVFRALGGGISGRGYAAKVPNTLLLKGKSLGGATPEKMTLRGTRLAYMEETPEEGYLDATVVKDLMDAEIIEGRFLYKNIVEWPPTHSIFLNTNHPPTVTDTGDGAWRRLARIDFPYRYRLNGDPLEREGDREGQADLKPRLGEVEAQEAVLAWVVAGALRWYAAGKTLRSDTGDPASIRASIARWRTESDDILRFIDARMELDAERWVSSDALYTAFREWALTNGHKPMSSKELAKRIKDHGALPGWVSAAVVRPSRAGGSWPFVLTEGHVLPAQMRAYVGLAFKIS
jgi:P4 family phage/plasmid primase-like protien